MYQLNLSVTDIVRTNHIPSPDFVVVSQVSKIGRRIIERGGGGWCYVFVYRTVMLLVKYEICTSEIKIYIESRVL